MQGTQSSQEGGAFCLRYAINHCSATACSQLIRTKAYFDWKLVTAAADDDDDDFFAEFNVDLDMDGDSAPPKPALSTVPEQSDNLDTNAVAAAAADDDESAVEASSIPMATDQAFSEPAAPDAAPEAADTADVQPGWCLHHAC